MAAKSKAERVAWAENMRLSREAKAKVKPVVNVAAVEEKGTPVTKGTNAPSPAKARAKPAAKIEIGAVLTAGPFTGIKAKGMLTVTKGDTVVASVAAKDSRTIRALLAKLLYI